ncbi:MAG: EAL domain-containing protein [Pseudomonadota bacterium]|nr:EAL domain-containing protein [Pseudomonadota bacterium]
MTDYTPNSPLLARQMRKAQRGGIGELDARKLLELVDQAYGELDRERRRGERAHRLMAGELEGAMAESALQARRFKLALDNMQEGLCLYDSEERLIVANDRFREIYDLPEIDDAAGLRLSDVLDRSGELARLSPRARTAAKREHLGMPVYQITAVEQEWSDDRRIQITRSPVDGGGFLETIVDRTDAYRAERHIHHLARHDPLTDLPNRMMMRERMEELVRNRQKNDRCAVLCLDLDRFKDVNDLMGHGVGDALLVKVADVLRQTVRHEDMVVRLGGDEFAIIQHRITTQAAVAALCQRIVDALAEPFQLCGQTVATGTSIGARIISADDFDPDKALGEADIALYAAKADGRGTWRLFDTSMSDEINLRREFEQSLRDAVENDQFVVHYQPQVDLRTREIYGFEALARWNHPVRGIVAPDEFISVCEESGLIDRLGETILMKACKDAQAWPRDVRLAVNVSAVQFKSGNLADIVADALETSGLSADLLELEITESVIIEDSRDVLRQLRKLKKLGVKISLDDFGTGYSSLSYVRNFPFDRVKIDKSFIRDLGSQKDSLAIVRAVAGMCGGLGIQSTTEGVETESQLRILDAEHYDSVQGFLFSPAVPGDVAIEMLANADQSGWSVRSAA